MISLSHNSSFQLHCGFFGTGEDVRRAAFYSVGHGSSLPVPANKNIDNFADSGAI